MKRMNVLLFSVAVLVAALCCSNASVFAAWPPLQAITKSVTTDDYWESVTIEYSVYDPQRQKNEQSGWTIRGGHNRGITNSTVQDGVVAWIAYYQDLDGREYEWGVYYAVYDPTRGEWKSDGMWLSEGYARTVGNLVISDGVVAYIYGYQQLQGQPWEWGISCATYDPVKGEWVRTGMYLQEGVSRYFSGPILNDGVVAWIAGYQPLQGAPWDWAVCFQIYDPSRGDWQGGGSGWSESSFSIIGISNATVRWSLNGTDHTSGYNPTSHSWDSNPTRPLSYFHASPVSGNPPLWVWFWDLSIGATSWSLNFGDGGSSSSRSTYHSYTGYGQYTTTQTVTGAGGTHSTSKTISTDSVAPAGSVSINNGAASTCSAEVTLTLSATDSSGSVPWMRFSSDSNNWTEWEAYATTKVWNLASGSGEQWVYAQFKDAAGNVSTTVGDSIVLDTYSGLAADFDAQGLWFYHCSEWSLLSPVSPDKLSTFGTNLVASFPGYGLYLYDGTRWTLLTSNGNVENMVGFSDRLYVDFGAAGLYQYDSSWTLLAGANPDKLEGGIIGSHLLASFPGFGLYLYDGTSWILLTSNTEVEEMTELAGTVYVDFGSIGLWKYDGVWTMLTSANPNHIELYAGKLTANFPGLGLYEHDGTGWTLLTTNSSAQDLFRLAGKLYVDFGAAGLYRYDGAWVQIAGADANVLNRSPDGSKMFVTFPGYGIYEYDRTNWKFLCSSGAASGLASVGSP